MFRKKTKTKKTCTETERFHLFAAEVKIPVFLLLFF